MRLLGIDYGRARTGIALGDTEVGLAFPHAVLETKDIPSLAAALAALAKTEDCEKIVVGVPRRLTGDASKGETEGEALALVEELKKVSGLPVDTEDERFTTAYAERLKRDAGGAVKIGADALAAAAILETYMVRSQAAGHRSQD